MRTHVNVGVDHPFGRVAHAVLLFPSAIACFRPHIKCDRPVPATGDSQRTSPPHKSLASRVCHIASLVVSALRELSTGEFDRLHAAARHE